MADRNNTSEELRELLRQYFQSIPYFQFTNTDVDPVTTIQNFARENYLQCPQISCYEVMSALWDMLIERIVEPKWFEGTDFRIIGFRLTKYGKNLLEGLPIDRPSKYLDYLKSQVPSIDNQIIVYVRESLHSYNLGCYFASSVMLGVAAERLFELLIDAYTNAIQTPNAQKQFQQKTVGRGISQQYDEFKKKLPGLIGKNGLTAEDGPSTTRFRQEFKHAIEITFDTLRSYRDYAAHPRDGEVPRHIIMCNLNAFPLFCQRVYQAIEWLGVNGV